MIPNRLLPPRQVNAGQDHERAERLLEPEALSEQYDPCGDAGEGDEVLVDEHPIRPDL